jgi:phage RecT family recombinase
MTTNSTDLVRRTDGVISSIENPLFLKQLEESLPEGVSLTKFKRIAISTIRANTDLLDCDENSLFGAIVKCAQDGLLPDGREAAIIKRGKYASYTPMIDGIRKKAAEHGWTIRTALVYDNDEFDHAVVAGEEVITHRPVRPGMERGEIIATYAIAKHRDGRRVQTVLHPDDVAARQALAQTDKVWKAWKGPMWEKSAGHDVFGQLGLAEIDKQAKSMLDALTLDAGEAKRLLYGGTSASKSGVTSAPSSQTTTSPPPGGEVDVTQQASSAAATPVQTPAAAEPVPGADDAEITAAAQEAAKLVPPEGVHATAGRTLAGIHALGEDGTRWFGMAMRKPDLQPEFRTALFNYARVYMPELFNTVIAESEVPE